MNTDPDKSYDIEKADLVERELDDWWFCDWCNKRLPISFDGYTGTNGICFCSKECSEDKDANR